MMLRAPVSEAFSASTCRTRRSQQAVGRTRCLVVRAQQDENPALGRPGGRGRAEFPASTPSTPEGPDPASISRPGGRGGRSELPSGSSSSSEPGQDPAVLSRPGGRGRGAEFSPVNTTEEAGWGPPPTDRPGGRGGRDVLSSSESDSDEETSKGGGGSGKGGSSGGGGDGSSGGSSSSEGGGFDLGKGLMWGLVYGGICYAAYVAHGAFFNKPAEAPKPCCAGKAKAAAK